MAQRVAAMRKMARYALAVIVIGTLVLALYPLNGPGATNLQPFSHKMNVLRCMANGGCGWMLLTRPVLIDWIGNVVVFVPFGAALAMATWPDRRPPGLLWWGRALLIGILFSLSIEVTQLSVPGRMTDIDDVILNTAGVLIGLVAGYIVVRLGSLSARLTTMQRGKPA